MSSSVVEMLLFLFVSPNIRQNELLRMEQMFVDIQVFQIYLELQTWVIDMELYTRQRAKKAFSKE